MLPLLHFSRCLPQITSSNLLFKPICYFHSSSRKNSEEKSQNNNLKPHTLLMDSRQIVYRGFYQNNRMPKGAAFGYAKYLLQYICDFYPFDSVVSVGEPMSKESWRYQFANEYKMRRADPPQSFIDQLSLVMNFTQLCGVQYYTREDFEAKDVIASFTKIALDKGHKVTIITQDLDLMSLVNPSVSIFNLAIKRLMDPKAVKERHKVEPEKIILTHSLAGDEADSIEGVPGVKWDQAALLIETYGTLEEILQQADYQNAPQNLLQVKQYKERIMRNISLFKLRQDISDLPALETLKLCPIDEKPFVRFLRREGFKSIVSTWEERGKKVLPYIESQEEVKRKSKERRPGIIESLRDNNKEDKEKD